MGNRLKANDSYERVPSELLRKGDIVRIAAGEVIPGDGEVIEGVAMVNESAITGESAPVVRESGGDRSAVTGGTTVISDHIIVRIGANPGESFMDKMITLIEGRKAAKDSQRNRPDDFAFGVDHYLSSGDYNSQALRILLGN